jgi:hypothetical protein
MLEGIEKHTKTAVDFAQDSDDSENEGHGHGAGDVVREERELYASFS